MMYFSTISFNFRTKSFCQYLGNAPRANPPPVSIYFELTFSSFRHGNELTPLEARDISVKQRKSNCFEVQKKVINVYQPWCPEAISRHALLEKDIEMLGCRKEKCTLEAVGYLEVSLTDSKCVTDKILK